MTFTQQAEEIKKEIGKIHNEDRKAYIRLSKQDNKVRNEKDIEDFVYNPIVKSFKLQLLEAKAKALQEAGTGFLSFLENIDRISWESWCGDDLNNKYLKTEIADIQNGLKLLEDVLK